MYIITYSRIRFTLDAPWEMRHYADAKRLNVTDYKDAIYG
jgi:hypothetical protein